MISPYILGSSSALEKKKAFINVPLVFARAAKTFLYSLASSLYVVLCRNRLKITIRAVSNVWYRLRGTLDQGLASIKSSNDDILTKKEKALGTTKICLVPKKTQHKKLKKN